MSTGPTADLQQWTNGVIRVQIAALDASLAYWQTLLAQSVAYADLVASTLDDLQSPRPSLAPGARRLASFGAGSAAALAQLSVKVGARTLETWAELSAPVAHRRWP
jgi:hypothetical protein